MYSDPIAYFLTFTTYGTWLHGRETGSVDRQHNIYETPVLAPNPELEQKQRAKMKQPEYRLDENQRTIVLETILEVAKYRNWYVWAAHVRSNHVHVVISAEAKPEKVLNDLKAWSSRRLKERLGEPPDRERWTRHGSTRHIWKEDVLAEKIRYVLDEQGERMAWFSNGSSIGAESVSDETGVEKSALTLRALTSFEMIDDAMADVLRQKSAVERLRIAARLWKSARSIVRGAIRTEHLDWTAEQVNHEIARRMSHGVVE